MSVLPPIDDCAFSCTPDCPSVFGRLMVRPTIVHGTWVQFSLLPGFGDPLPHAFQLQEGRTGSNLADDWIDVGLPFTDATYAIDTEQRAYGKTQFTHYRIKLTTTLGTYYSDPADCYGNLSFRSWRIWSNRLRQYRLQMERTIRGQPGFLLKRRIAGPRPTLGEGIVDYLTEEVVNPQAELTAGTSYIHGYFDPIPCFFADPDALSRREKLDDNYSRGTVNDEMRVGALLLGVPLVDSYDVLVNAQSDFRWVIHSIKNLEEIDGVAIVVKAEIRRLPFSDPVYKIPMPS